MLTVIEKILFLVLAGICGYYAYTGFKRIVDAVKRGEKGYYPRLNDLPKRIADAVIKTMSQTTVFRARPWVSFFHSFVFYGFMFYLLVNVFDGLRGFIPPSWIPWSFGSLGAAYRLLADLLTILILVGVVWVRGSSLSPLASARLKTPTSALRKP